MPQSLSQVQNHIISRLKNARAIRYAELKPGKIPNDLFNYHLQFLVKKGLIEKKDGGYALARPGIKLVADTDDAMFKVNVITLVSRVRAGRIEILNQIRTSHPSFGKIGAMGGVVRKGESLETAARRKLKTETGLDAEFKMLGIERRMMYEGEKLFSDILFPIAYAKKIEGVLTDTEFGHNLWVGIDDAIQNESAEFDSIKMIPYTLRAVKAKRVSRLPFFYEEDIQRK